MKYQILFSGKIRKYQFVISCKRVQKDNVKVDL